MATALDFADPFSILPNCVQRSKIAGIENVFGRAQEPAVFQVVPGVTGADRDELQHAGVAVAINHAPGASIPDELRLIELIDIAHGSFPEVAPIQVKVPIEIKILMSAKATELFGLPPQMALHFGMGFGGIDHRKSTAFLHLLDLFEDLDQLVRLVANQARIAEAQITGSQVG